MKGRIRRRLLLANYVHIFGSSLLSVMYALYGVHIGANAWQIGSSWAVYNCVAGLTNILSGKFADKSRHAGRMVFGGYLITVLAMLMFLFITVPYQLYLVQAIHGLGVGLYMPAWKLLYLKMEYKHREAREWGVFDGGNMLIMAASALLGGLLVNSSRYQSLLLVVAGSFAIAAIVAYKEVYLRV